MVNINKKVVLGASVVGVIILGVLSFTYFTSQSHDTKHHEAKLSHIQTNSDVNKSTETENTTASKNISGMSALNEKNVSDFITAYYTRNAVGDNNTKFQGYMSSDLYATVTSSDISDPNYGSPYQKQSVKVKQVKILPNNNWAFVQMILEDKTSNKTTNKIEKINFNKKNDKFFVYAMAASSLNEMSDAKDSAPQTEAPEISKAKTAADEATINDFFNTFANYDANQTSNQQRGEALASKSSNAIAEQLIPGALTTDTAKQNYPAVSKMDKLIALQFDNQAQTYIVTINYQLTVGSGKSHYTNIYTVKVDNDKISTLSTVSTTRG